jgi:hypothetical protein
MSRRLLSAIAIGGIVLAIIAISAQAADKTSQSTPADSVKRDFAALKSAVEKRDGKVAAGLVTPPTIDVYERCRKLALNSASSDFAEMPQFDVLLTFQLRYLLSAAELRKMDGNAIFVWSVSYGLVSVQSFAELEVAAVQVEGKTAVASLLKAKKPVTDLVLYFTLGEKNWQLDMKRIMQAMEPALTKVRKDSGKGKVELAVFLMERTYKEKIPPQILNGPLKEDAEKSTSNAH